MRKVQPATMSNKCKLVLALLVGLVITVPPFFLIVWGVKSNVKGNIKDEPAINSTTIALTDCLDKSVNFSTYPNNSMVTVSNNTTSKNGSLRITEEKINTSSKNGTVRIREEQSNTSAENRTSPTNQKTGIKSNIYFFSEVDITNIPYF